MESKSGLVRSTLRVRADVRKELGKEQWPQEHVPRFDCTAELVLISSVAGTGFSDPT